MYLTEDVQLVTPTLVASSETGHGRLNGLVAQHRNGISVEEVLLGEEMDGRVRLGTVVAVKKENSFDCEHVFPKLSPRSRGGM